MLTGMLQKAFISTLLLLLCVEVAGAHTLYFAGEAIPTARAEVANKLVSVIRRQIPAVTLTYLRAQAQRNFPAISAWLKRNNVPDDFKYIPIVESGFRNNLTSPKGARGLWQLMPDVARSMNLVVTPVLDQRLDAGLATQVACILIRRKYDYLKEKLGVGSWVLTAAAYNFGEGNIAQQARAQGKDYFSMALNAETAEYVYRLIAVKELFEHPELYMNDFGRNIFSKEALQQVAGTSPETIERGEAVGGLESDEQELAGVRVVVDANAEPLEPAVRTNYVFGRIITTKKGFVDGDKITVELINDLDLGYAFKKKGTRLTGIGWIIDDRVQIDFGYGNALEVFDMSRQRGISEQLLTDKKNTLMLCVKREGP